LFLAAALVVFGWRYRAATSPVKPAARAGEAALLRAKPPSAGERGTVAHGPSDPDRKQMREQFFRELNLTPEQQTKMDEIEKEIAGKTGREAWSATREAISKVLTPEQMQKLAQTAAARDAKKAGEQFKVLPPEERAKLEKKMNEKVKRDAQRLGANHQP
jgi:Spy/CpxP family protein refolding chaperone